MGRQSRLRSERRLENSQRPPAPAPRSVSFWVDMTLVAKYQWLLDYMRPGLPDWGVSP